MSGEKTMFSIMVISFILIALVMIAVKKYTDKHKTLFNYTQIIVGFFVLLILGFILLIKSISKGEYENIVENVTLKTKVTSITFDMV